MSKFSAKDFEHLVKSQIQKQKELQKCDSIANIQLVLFYSLEKEDVTIEVLKDYNKVSEIDMDELLGWKSFFVSKSKMDEIKKGIKDKMLTNGSEMGIAEGQMRIMYFFNPRNNVNILIWLYDGDTPIKKMTFQELLD